MHAKENAALAVINVHGCKEVMITKRRVRKNISNIEQKLKHQQIKNTNSEDESINMMQLTCGISVSTSTTSHHAESICCFHGMWNLRTSKYPSIVNTASSISENTCKTHSRPTSEPHAH